MVKLKYHTRYQRWRKGDVYGGVEDEESHSCLGFLSGNSPGFSNKKGRPNNNNKLLYLAFLSFLYFTLIYLFSSSTFSFLRKHFSFFFPSCLGFFFFFLVSELNFISFSGKSADLFRVEDGKPFSETNLNASLCSFVPNGKYFFFSRTQVMDCAKIGSFFSFLLIKMIFFYLEILLMFFLYLQGLCVVTEVVLGQIYVL